MTNGADRPNGEGDTSSTRPRPTHRSLPQPSREKKQVQPVPRRETAPPPPGSQRLATPYPPPERNDERNQLDQPTNYEVQQTGPADYGGWSPVETQAIELPQPEILMPAPPAKKGLLDTSFPDPPAFETGGHQLTEDPGLPTIQARQASARQRNSERRLVWIGVVITALLVGVLVRIVAVQAIYTPSSVMDPTIKTGDRFYVNKLAYTIGSPERGDIVVLDRTLDSVAADSEGPGYLIRRVIGTEGETIEAKNNQIMIDGAVLLEPYLDSGTFLQDFEPITVPEDAVFVLSDSRREIVQSSQPLGPRPIDDIAGKVVFTYWPRSSFGSP